MFVIGLVIAAILFLLDHYFPPKLDKCRDCATAFFDKEERLISALLAKDQRWRFKVHLEEIDPLFIKMLVQFEDKRYFYHPGVDPLALLRALGQWLSLGKVVSGGSSITMQTVRLLDPQPRNFFAKLKEMARALQLECHFSKKEILEIYLSITPYGGNVEGIKAACWQYFGKSPKTLTPSEAAFLVALPQAPNRFEKEAKTDFLLRGKNKVLKRMIGKNILSDTTLHETLQSGDLPQERKTFQRLAAHMAFRWASLYPNHKLQHTFLEMELQKQLEIFLKQQLLFLSEGQNIAAMVVENKTHRVVAYLGSADFFDEARKGQVNMIHAYRSPGSLLKPFIYGMAFDEGWVQPHTQVQDAPRSFAGYCPSNFKDIFHGDVSIAEALKQSLNVPAVMLLENIGPGKFYMHLRSMPVDLKFEKANATPSLPLALGGVGMTLWDLVSLYSAIANGGAFHKLSMTSNENENDLISVEKQRTENRIMSEKSAAYITQILQNAQAPDGFVDRGIIHRSGIAYKTGTSYGYRDAFAIGYNTQYTVGVWLGKTDGSACSTNTGRNTAAPILFKIFDMLPAPSQNFYFPDLFALNLKKNTVQKFVPDVSNAARENNKALKIIFPKNGSVLQLDKFDQTDKLDTPDNALENSKAWRDIKIAFKGGKPPYFCLINGHPAVNSLQQNYFYWQPESPGFVEFTIIDSNGASDSISLELKDNK